MTRPAAVWVLELLVVAALAAGCGAGAGRSLGGPAQRGAVVAGRLPLLDGGEIDLAGLRGSPLVVHFFTTWSLAAQADVERLRAARDASGGKVNLLGVALDPEGYKLVAPWRDGAGVDYPVALATDEIAAGESGFGDVMRVVPSTVIIDTEGRVVWSRRGPLGENELEKRLVELGLM